MLFEQMVYIAATAAAGSGKIKVSSSPAIDNTYHSWDDETLRFNFYK